MSVLWRMPNTTGMQATGRAHTHVAAHALARLHAHGDHAGKSICGHEGVGFEAICPAKSPEEMTDSMVCKKEQGRGPNRSPTRSSSKCGVKDLLPRWDWE